MRRLGAVGRSVVGDFSVEVQKLPRLQRANRAVRSRVGAGLTIEMHRRHEQGSTREQLLRSRAAVRDDVTPPLEEENAGGRNAGVCPGDLRDRVFVIRE